MLYMNAYLCKSFDHGCQQNVSQLFSFAIPFLTFSRIDFFASFCNSDNFVWYFQCFDTHLNWKSLIWYSLVLMTRVTDFELNLNWLSTSSQKTSWHWKTDTLNIMFCECSYNLRRIQSCKMSWKWQKFPWRKKVLRFGVKSMENIQFCYLEKFWGDNLATKQALDDRFFIIWSPIISYLLYTHRCDKWHNFIVNIARV